MPMALRGDDIYCGFTVLVSSGKAYECFVLRLCVLRFTYILCYGLSVDYLRMSMEDGFLAGDMDLTCSGSLRRVYFLDVEYPYICRVSVLVGCDGYYAYGLYATYSVFLYGLGNYEDILVLTIVCDDLGVLSLVFYVGICYFLVYRVSNELCGLPYGVFYG